MPHASLCFLAPLGVTVASLATLVWLGVTGWPGETGVSGVGFCEAIRPGPIKQPANTWSNAGFFVVGLWIGWQAWRDVVARKAATWNNRFVSTVWCPASYATTSIVIGAGSTALHASTTRWGAEFDLFALHLWGVWCIAFSVTRLLRGGDRLFAALLTALIAVLVARIATRYPFDLSGASLFGAMVVTAIAIETAGLWRNRKRQKLDLRYLAWAVIVFLVAYACSLSSKSDSLWCEPTSPWQGHALWHVLACGSTAFVYLYGRSERAITISDSAGSEPSQ